MSVVDRMREAPAFVCFLCDRCGRPYRTSNRSPICASCTPRIPVLAKEFVARWGRLANEKVPAPAVNWPGVGRETESPQ